MFAWPPKTIVEIINTVPPTSPIIVATSILSAYGFIFDKGFFAQFIGIVVYPNFKSNYI
jgi:hypothetical protein